MAKISHPEGGKALEENILCDDSSNITLIDENKAHELGLTGDRLQTKITGVGGKVEIYSAMYTEIELTSMSGKVKRKIKAKVIPNPTGNLFATDWSSHRSAWPHLRKLPFSSPVGDGHCRIILGTDQAYLHQALEEVPGAPSFEPIARRTPLGWTCVGRIKPGAPTDKERTFLSYRASGIIEGSDSDDRILGSPILCRPEDRLALKSIVQAQSKWREEYRSPCYGRMNNIQKTITFKH